MNEAQRSEESGDEGANLTVLLCDASTIWAFGNKCSTLHILPSLKYTPSLCGFEPTPNRGGTAKWSVMDIDEALKHKTRAFVKCKKCLEIINT